MGVCPLKAPASATSAIGFSRRAHSVTCAERAPAVHTYAWDEPQGTGACADGADRADAAVLTYM